MVTAHKVGQTTIHAIANDGGGAKATCTVIVDPTMVASISLSDETMKIRKNHQAQLSATVTPVNATDARFVWSSTNEAVAKVSEEGVISAIAPGDAIIKATAQDGSKVEASCQVKVLPVLKGDSNDDDEINIVDAVNTVNYILNKVTGTFAFEAADVNSDGSISVSDVTGTTALIMQQSLEAKSNVAMAKAQKSRNALVADCLVLSQKDKKSVGVTLDNNGIYAALQTDVVLSVDASNVTVKLEDAIASTHQLTYAKLNARTLRVVVYSLSNSTFMDGNAIFSLASDKSMNASDIQIQNTIASDAEAVGHRLDSRMDETTSIATVKTDGAPVQAISNGVIIRGEVDTPIYIYTASGILVKSFRLTSEEIKVNLREGIYLVKLNGHVTKITVK